MTTTTSLVNAAIPTVSTHTGPPPQPPLPAHNDDDDYEGAGEHRQAVRGHQGLKTRLEPSGVSFFLFLYMFID
jgi:hypothetical protein